MGMFPVSRVCDKQNFNIVINSICRYLYNTFNHSFQQMNSNTEDIIWEVIHRYSDAIKLTGLPIQHEEINGTYTGVLPVQNEKMRCVQNYTGI